MKRKSLLATLLAVAGLQLYQAQAQTTFDGININNGQNLVFKGFSNGVNDPTDAGDVVFQKANGDELTRIRSLYDAATGLASICFSSSPLINATFLFTGEGNLGIGSSVPRTRLDVQPPIGNISTGVFRSNGEQSWGHALALVTDKAAGDDPKLLFSYRNRTKQWSIGGTQNSTTFNIMEDGGDGFHGNGFGAARLTVMPGGNIGIGTSNPQAKLAVEGNILAKEIKIKTDINVPDYVFEPDYDLKSLEEIESYVKANKHLPEIPSAKQIQADGLDLAEMNLLLLKKVEEMTLQLIQMNNEMKKQAEKIEGQAEKIQLLEKR
ncbi:hypothetical protein [Sphingobacterium multivorum]|uniref:hypothetical protein n=1 Tax=Sphingobacterium multivorum TaxID=28454 RepID=UPI0031BB28AD